MQRFLPLAALLLATACKEDAAKPKGGQADSGVPERGDVPDAEAPAPAVKRLTQAQYTNAMRDLFGDAIVLPASLEPDVRIEGLYAVGAARTTVSSYGVEKYEQAAYSIAAQVLEDPDARARWVPCTPEAAVDDACAETVLSELALHAWRRPATPTETDILVDLAHEAASTLDDFDAGLEYGIAGVLMSPYTLYRVELGDSADAPDGGYDDYELASRLSFFLWNTIPDSELLSAAAAGELTTDAGLEAQVDRMLVDERAQQGVRNLFTEMLHLDELDDLSKDPLIYTYMRDTLGADAREETLLGIEALVFDDDGSYLDLFTTERTYLNRDLAALYDVQAPAREGFAEAWLDPAGGRRGFFGQASFLALNAHAVSTSVTLRGIFVREVLLCQEIPEPPANANTAIPEVDADAPTMRERFRKHLEVEECASCHRLTDPIGLGFENFDGLGRYREQENGVTIDASGDLDGAAFADAWDVGAAVADHPRTPTCMTRTALQYATGNLVEEIDEDLLDWHTLGFRGEGERVLWLMRDVALSPVFRQVGEVE